MAIDTSKNRAYLSRLVQYRKQAEEKINMSSPRPDHFEAKDYTKNSERAKNMTSVNRGGNLQPTDSFIESSRKTLENVKDSMLFGNSSSRGWVDNNPRYYTGIANDLLHELGNSATLEMANNLGLNTLWRLAITASQNSSKLPKHDKSNDKLDNTTIPSSSSDIETITGKSNDKYYASRISLVNAKSARDNNFNPFTDVDYNKKLDSVTEQQLLALWDTRKTDAKKNNTIRIYNLDSGATDNERYIEIQNRPISVDVNPSSAWLGIKTMGRNNPFMIYTGGEDSISLELSWYATDKNIDKANKEVIRKCRLLESWSKADAYDKAPPVLTIQWGNGLLFAGAMWVLESAPFTLSGFRNLVVDRNSGLDPQDGQLYPILATQKIVLKRVIARNTTRQEIQELDISEILNS